MVYIEPLEVVHTKVFRIAHEALSRPSGVTSTWALNIPMAIFIHAISAGILVAQ